MVKLDTEALLLNLLCSVLGGLIIELLKLGIKEAPKLKSRKTKKAEELK